tara:strand:- start:48 stop:797 length:750 start_codon:yes stop_codon:yes gene_type:complete
MIEEPKIDPSKTQIPTTKATYKKYGSILKKLNIKDKVLDYSSGLGTGTKELSSEAKGFEPYFDKERTRKAFGIRPVYENVDEMARIEGLKSQKAIVNHMVLNVVDDIQERKNVVNNIGNMLADDGVAFITARDSTEGKTRVPYKDGYLMKKGGTNTFQKPFSQTELNTFVKGTLGKDYTVVDTPKKLGIGGSSVMVTKSPTFLKTIATTLKLTPILAMLTYPLSATEMGSGEMFTDKELAEQKIRQKFQ